jgi:hypothetical protein
VGKWLLVVGCVLLGFRGRADEGRSRLRFPSPNGRFELRALTARLEPLPDTASLTGGTWQHDSLRWGLFAAADPRPRYLLRGDNLSAKSVFVADDGQAVAVLDDFSRAAPRDTLPVLAFYARGRLLRTYALGELLCSADNVSESSSHFSWLAGFAFDAPAGRLTLRTYELTTLTFAVATGQRLTRTRDPRATPTAFLGAGTVHRVGQNRYELTVEHRALGPVPDGGKLTFTTRSGWVEGEFVTVLLDQGQEVHQPDVSDWWLNQGNWRLGARRPQPPCP